MMLSIHNLAAGFREAAQGWRDKLRSSLPADELLRLLAIAETLEICATQTEIVVDSREVQECVRDHARMDMLSAADWLRWDLNGKMVDIRTLADVLVQVGGGKREPGAWLNGSEELSAALETVDAEKLARASAGKGDE